MFIQPMLAPSLQPAVSPDHRPAGFGTTSYVDYLTPGVVIMTAFLSGTWAGMGMIEDLDRGVVERFLATPHHRSAIVFARVLQSARRRVGPGGDHPRRRAAPRGHERWASRLARDHACRALVAAGFSGISNGIGSLTRQEATMIAVANFIGLPLLFFSSILIAGSLIPGWMETLSLGNPVEWAVRASRAQVLPGTDWGQDRPLPGPARLLHRTDRSLCDTLLPVVSAHALERLCRGTNEDLVDVNVQRLREGIEDGSGDVPGLERWLDRHLREERCVDDAGRDHRDPDAGAVEALDGQTRPSRARHALWPSRASRESPAGLPPSPSTAGDPSTR